MQNIDTFILIMYTTKAMSKDFINVTVETLRSPSPADSWHHRNGYISKEAVEAFIHSKEFGQVARLTHFY